MAQTPTTLGRASVPDSPEGTSLERNEHGVSITLTSTVPNQTINRLRKRGIACLIVAGILALAFAVTGLYRSVMAPVVVGLIGVFGLLQWMGARNLVNSGAIIDVVCDRDSPRPDDVLMINERELFEKRLHRWGVNEIAAVNVGAADFRDMGRPIPKLQIHLTNGTIHRLLPGRDKQELMWIAQIIRDETGLPDQPRTAET